MPRACPHCGGRHSSRQTRCEVTGQPIGGDPTLVGRTVAGRYALVRLLGDGGMGAVYKAADQVLRRFVAIKMLHATVVNNPSSVERFKREARAAAGIGHPNIIDVLDFGEEDGQPYMVMEYLRGSSLSEILSSSGPLPIDSACAIASYALLGLSAAHEHGILHRDLKPANLMVIPLFGERHFVKICDFGFAALFGTTSELGALTPERTLVGTPAYAAPERLRGDDRRDPRVDVYSIGVVLFEMLSGRRPFDGPNFAELSKKVKYEPAPSLRALRANVPAELEAVVQKALAKDPDERWPHARAFAQALVPFGGRIYDRLEESKSDSFTKEMERIKKRDGKRRVAAPALEPNTPEKTVHQTAYQGDVAPRPAADSRLASAVLKGIDAQLAAGEPPSVRGAVLRALFQYVEGRFGAVALNDVLRKMTLMIDRGAIEAQPAEWFDWGYVETFVEQVDRELGSDDLFLTLECGRAAAGQALKEQELLQAQQPGLDTLGADLPWLLSSICQGFRFEFQRAGPGFARLHMVRPTKPTLTTTIVVLGFLERALERCGGQDVEVNLVGSRALGDPQTLVDVSWLPHGDE